MNMYNQYLQGQQQNPYIQQRATYPVQSNGIIWVQGVEGAKAYQMNPNSILQLMDSENDGIFYIKISDNIGMTTLRVFKYEEINNTRTPQIDTSQFVTRQELQDALAKIGDRTDEQPIPTTKRNNSKQKPLITE